MTLSPMNAARAVALVEDDRSLRYVAQVLHTTPSTVSRTVQRYKELGSYSRRPRYEDLPLAQNLKDNIVKLAYNFQGNIRNGLTNCGEQFCPQMSPDSASDPQMEEKEYRGGLEKEVFPNHKANIRSGDSFLDVKGARRVLRPSDWRTGESSYSGQPTRFLSSTAASERSSQAALGQGGSRRRASYFCRPGGGHLRNRHFLKSSLLVPLPHRRSARRKPRSLRRAVRTNFPRPGGSRSGIGSSLEETPSRPRPLGRLPARERLCAFVPE
ncbi:hypothetical protein ANN_21468 [Periplaneta americana]|uniref:Uncharacterized protein n=1 Tax=Periplaneta americana TaxID=6978 RepID=A0ABQ8SG47_PERAM|nr:hypothetical protein ANN_21468 [Periplaneta americana]